LLLSVQSVQGFVFSCNEVKYRLVNGDPPASTKYACVSLGNEYYAFDELGKIFLQNDNVSVSPFFLSLAAFASSPGGCISSSASGGSWRVVADPSISLRCGQEMALIFTSVLPHLIPVTSTVSSSAVVSNDDDGLVFVNPRGGILMGVASCVGDGNVTLFTGAGSGVVEHRFPMKTWRCADGPRWIVSFDNVVTLTTDQGTRVEMAVIDHFSNGHAEEVDLKPGERAAVLTSGRSDNVQNLANHQNVAHFRL
ncbi:hypothetical protein PFISCL1PPCAC_18752, partial [Pristionchus fissidentatus]